MSRVEAKLKHFSYITGARTEGTKIRTEEHYLVQPIKLDQPKTGIQDIRIICNACRKEVNLRLLGKDEVTKKRIKHLLTAIALAVLASLLIILRPHVAGGLPPILLAFLFLSSLAGMIYSVYLSLAPSRIHILKIVGVVPSHSLIETEIIDDSKDAMGLDL